MIITMDILLTQVSGLQADEIEHWIVNAWIRPDGTQGAWAFQEIDVARIRLIRELRDDMLVNEEAIPVVLSLLDQLHDTRRHLQQLVDTLRSHGPAL